MLFDTHSHIQFRAFDADRESVVKKCSEINMIVNVIGTQKDTSFNAIKLAEKHDWMFATIGIHPVHLFPTYIDEEESRFLSREENFDLNYFEELVKSPKVKAIGETGLDLFHLPKNFSKEDVLKKQTEVFLDQMRFADNHNLSLVIHCRDAYEELLDVLETEMKKLKNELRAVIHCYTGNWKYAQKFLQLGFYLGFTGVITFPPKKTNPEAQINLLEVVEKIPLDRIVVETDSPYLAPQTWRGKRAEPWMIKEVVQKIAITKQISSGEVEKLVSINARNLFKVNI